MSAKIALRYSSILPIIAGTVSANNLLFTGTVSANNLLFVDTVSANNLLFADTVLQQFSNSCAY